MNSIKLFVVFLLSGLLVACDDDSPAAPLPKTVSDTYPGDTTFTDKVQQLFRSAAADRIHLPWAGNRTLTRLKLCEALVQRHYVNVSPGMGETNANFLGCPDVTQPALLNACIVALNTPQGFKSPEGWDVWRGQHRGTWFDDKGKRFDDQAEWDSPRKEPSRLPGDVDSSGDPRKYDFQDVRWPGPPPRNGWNQSHPDVPYVWGWDPKSGHDENGDIGTHLGFIFKLPPCEFIIWLTPKEAFLEGINTDAEVARAVNGRTVRGYPKTSTGFNGRGQWAVDR